MPSKASTMTEFRLSVGSVPAGGLAPFGELLFKRAGVCKYLDWHCRRSLSQVSLFLSLLDISTHRGERGSCCIVLHVTDLDVRPWGEVCERQI